MVIWVGEELLDSIVIIIWCCFSISVIRLFILVVVEVNSVLLFCRCVLKFDLVCGNGLWVINVWKNDVLIKFLVSDFLLLKVLYLMIVDFVNLCCFFKYWICLGNVSKYNFNIFFFMVSLAVYWVLSNLRLILFWWFVKVGYVFIILLFCFSL